MRKRIVLANLDVTNGYDYDRVYYPLGLSSIGVILEKCGLEVCYYDANLDICGDHRDSEVYNAAATSILQIEPDYVCFFTRCDILPRVILCAKVLRAMSDVKIILGGPGVFTIEQEILKKYPFIDLIICGEGEKTVEKLFEKGFLNLNFSKIKGVAFIDDNKMFIKSKSELIQNLDDLPIPKRFIGKNIVKDKAVYVEAGRGCPYECSFCSTSMYWERKYRVKSPARLLDEIEMLYKNGYTHFILIHDNLAVSSKYVIDLRNEFLKRKLPITWSCSTRIDLIDEQKLKALSEAGCTNIYFGIESGSEKIQKIVGKNIDISIVLEKLSLCEQYGITTTRSFIIGFENEDEADVELTLQLAIKTAKISNSMTQLHYLIPIAGTKVTTDNKNELFYDEKLITFLSTKIGKAFLDTSEIALVKGNPDLFSSFYKIKDQTYNDRYGLVYCFSHFLIYYPKLLNILLEKDITALQIWDLIKRKCHDYPKCIDCSCEVGEGGTGICVSPMQEFVDICKFSSIQQRIIKHEIDKRNYIIENELYKNYKTI